MEAVAIVPAHELLGRGNQRVVLSCGPEQHAASLGQPLPPTGDPTEDPVHLYERSEQGEADEDELVARLGLPRGEKPCAPDQEGTDRKPEADEAQVPGPPKRTDTPYGQQTRARAHDPVAIAGPWVATLDSDSGVSALPPGRIPAAVVGGTSP